MTFEDRLQSIRTNRRPTVLRFCNLAEQQLIRSTFNSQDYAFDGGYHNAERKRAYLFTDPQDDIVCMQINPIASDEPLTHPSILGSLMGLSITPASIGDILADQRVVFVTAEMAAFIKHSLTHVGRQTVDVEQIDGRSVVRHQEYEEHMLVVASLRLDLVVAKIANASRSEAAEWVAKELVKRNQVIVTKPTITLQEGDVLSIRRVGRFHLDDASQRTKKDKIRLIYRKFV